MNGIRGFISGVWNGTRSVVSSVVNSIRSVISSVFGSLGGIATRAFNSVRNAVSNGIRGAYNAVTNILGRFRDAGRRIVTSIADGIRGAIGQVKDAIGNVTSAIRNFLPFSPAKDGPLRDLNKLNFGGTIAESIRRGAGKVLSVTDRLVSDMQKKLYVSEIKPMTLKRNYAYEYEHASNKQPAYIVVRLGNSEFTRFVEDITEVQGRNENIRRSFA